MTWAGDDKQIKLEDIEQDTLTNEERDDVETEQKELPQQTQHIELNYSNAPQDIFVTPQPRYNSKGKKLVKNNFIKTKEILVD